MQAVITAAGLGTRLLPASKEIPKEMFPIPVNGSLKPIIHVIFEQLYDQGVKDFVIVVGRNKRVIENYFTPDYDFVRYLEGKGKVKLAKELSTFYSKIEGSNIAFVNQPEPRGFGDAVLRAEPFVKEDFLVIGADTIVNDLNVNRMEINSFLVTRVNDPENYGVVVLDHDNYVIDIEEKPKHPKSNIVVVPYYRFSLDLFDALKDVKPDVNGEIQLTNGIKVMINKGFSFRAVVVEKVYDLGNFESYVLALRSFI